MENKYTKYWRKIKREREREPFMCGKIENYAWNERGDGKFIVRE